MSDLLKKVNTKSTAKTVYILYILSTVIGLLGVVGVIIAYVNKDDAPLWLKSHYQFQVRTFWLGLAFMVVALLLTFVLIGYLLLLVWAVWLIIRCAKGIKILGQQAPHPLPRTWLW